MVALKKDEKENRKLEDFTKGEKDIAKAQIAEVKVLLPKFQAERVGFMMDDENIPAEILTYDTDGNKTGISLVGYIGYLHAGLKELILKNVELEERIESLENK